MRPVRSTLRSISWGIPGVASVRTRRAAPAQVNYLGYPEMPKSIDCVLADRSVAPETARRSYAEQVDFASNLVSAREFQTNRRSAAHALQNRVLPEELFIFLVQHELQIRAGRCSRSGCVW